MSADTQSIDTVVLDVDGTLVDSVYEHAVAWARAFHDVGLTVPAQVVHAGDRDGLGAAGGARGRRRGRARGR